jgi:glycosyltransferase involved in cell wall biosynthesis
MTSESSPLVSILINNYNYGHYLPDAIDSAIAQTYPHKEVIVVDDGSTDNSQDVIASYGEEIVSVLKENGGQASAFNAGFAVSRGEILFFLDADDLFVPDKVAKVTEVYERDAAIGWSFHPQKLIDSNRNPIVTIPTVLGKSQQYDFRVAMKKGKLNPFLPSWRLPATSAFSFRRSLLQQILPMPEVIRITSDDYLKFSALSLSPGFILEQELSLQRIHGNNAFTLKKDRDKQLVEAKVNLLTAYWLKTNFAHLAKFGNNIFALGLYAYQKMSVESIELSEIIDKYLIHSTLLERWEINLRVLLRRLKNE